MARRSREPTSVDAEVNHVRSLGIVALRGRWREIFGANPPSGLTKDIIARMIAHRLQEEASGGLARDAIKLLGRLARGERARELNRRLKPGTVVVREYKGEQHSVTIVADGFLWQERTYSSLSMIARVITGTAWNGPRFSGLRTQDSVEGYGASLASLRRSPSGKRSNGRGPLSVRASATSGQAHFDG
jgi:hypothetical protein